MDKKEESTWLDFRVCKAADEAHDKLQRRFLLSTPPPPFTRRFGFGKDNLSLYGNPWTLCSMTKCIFRGMDFESILDESKEIRVAPDLVLDADHKTALVTLWILYNQLGAPNWYRHTIGQLLAAWYWVTTVFADDGVVVSRDHLVTMLVGFLRAARTETVKEEHKAPLTQFVTKVAQTVPSSLLSDPTSRKGDEIFVLLTAIAMTCQLDLTPLPELDMVRAALEGPMALRAWCVSHQDYPPLKKMAQTMLLALRRAYAEARAGYPNPSSAELNRIQLSAAVAVGWAQTFGLSLTCAEELDQKATVTTLDSAALTYFCQAKQAELVEQGHPLPSQTSATTMFLRMKQQWSQLTDTEKEPFLAKAREADQKALKGEDATQLTEDAAAATCSPIERMS